MNYCALTFDDGPSSLTNLVLDRLEKYEIPATFFVVGKCITEETGPVMERIQSLSCEFGNHSWSFEPMDTMSKEEIEESIQKTDNAIRKYTGSPALFFRPPNLAVSETLYKNVKKPFAQGLTGNDWSGCNTTAQQRAHLVLDQTKDGSIILLHDTQIPPHPTPEALDIIIPELLIRNFTFVTLTSLFEIKGINPYSLTKAMWNFL
ncbi:MAG: polysaccharide deacetylase family protein [Spirochaetaceae bacterium]|jgi:peptidoglycan-N-acetylglucosamine deacetylase|nr:polysaccharide deacetylase family protein [Spirochaetaceae bacterium]